MNKITWEKDKLWQGCILASIAHAINVAHYPDTANEHSWDGFNYNVQDSAGSRGTITFHPNYVVCAFRNNESERIKEFKDALVYFTDAPKEVKTLALNETLQYLLDDIEGSIIPVITTAFWGDGDDLYSSDKEEELKENGGFLLETQTRDIKISIDKWKKEFEMSVSQINLIMSIFNRKLKSPSENIYLTNEEINIIGTDDEEGLNESKISFSEFGVLWGD
ncbi:hypothetical protein [Pontibacillus sp. HMF3514]|uniref:hypothetical protein n=1 Tax=Pontibacillus sp. HMF3514 TaxID=2692425 RepID=UPI00131F9D3D|nr:hypothetical protein [Pontibacillus sp. HMF3514]QHE51583.1 hypothetical protein GS400_05830 [Pontibacillus sp. HMF3514]